MCPVVAGGGAPSFGVATLDAAELMSGEAAAAAASATKALFDEVFLIIRAAISGPGNPRKMSLIETRIIDVSSVYANCGLYRRGDAVGGGSAS